MSPRSAWCGGVLMAATVLASPLVAHAQDHGDTPDAPAPTKLEDVARLTVHGDAELRKPADELHMTIGVTTEATLPSTALAENTARMRKVVKAVLGAGLDEDDYETGRFQIRPQYGRRPRQPDPDWRPQIVGYEVVNQITLRTGQLDLAGKLIEVANEAGANAVEITGFGLADARTHRAEAIGVATRNAITDAKTLAAAASLRLVRIIRINLDQSSAPDIPLAVQTRAMSADSAGAPPIKAGDVTVKAGVSIVYEIAPLE